jgi:hypothetical protein
MKRTISFIFVLIAVLVGGTLTWELAYDDYAETAKEIAEMVDSAELACGQIGELMPMFPTLEATRSRGAVHDARSAVDHHGCRIDLYARNVALISGHWPHEIVRQRLLADYWQEDISRAADGPGSTAFAATKDSVACLFSASWTLGDQTDPEPVASEYRLGVGCFRIAADKRSEW